jgi:imidazolonepropionase
LIADFGMYRVPVKADKTIDANGKDLTVLDDSHTHIVYTGNREEFVDRINGLSYEEIANRVVVLNSAKSSTKQLKNKSIINLKSA